jgi:hypothetical protein
LVKEIDRQLQAKQQTKMQSTLMKGITKDDPNGKTLELSDLKLLGAQKLSTIKFGIEHDDYLTFSIKNKQGFWTNMPYLLSLGIFPLTSQNGTGFTYLH